MEKADKRNVVAPRSSVNFKRKGACSLWSPVTCRTAKLKAARVPGYDALMIGLMNFSSNSSTVQSLPSRASESVLLWLRLKLFVHRKNRIQTLGACEPYEEDFAIQFCSPKG